MPDMPTIYGEQLPSKLYKYRSVADEDQLHWLRAMVVYDRFYWPTPPQFNDPFDCAPVYQRMEGREMKENVRALVRRVSPGLNRLNRRAKQRELLNEDEAVYEKRYKDVHEMMQETAVYSLTTKPDSMLMWSHYGCSHQGVCLRFNASVLFNTFSPAGIMGLPVKYSETRPTIVVGRAFAPKTLLQECFLVKATAWSYEREWRFLHYRGKAGVRDFPPDALDGIILGARAGEATETTVRQIISQRTKPIPLFRAHVDRHHFAVTVDFDKPV
jgi:hypothetical protein